MVRLTLSARAQSNLVRIFEFYAREDPMLAARVVTYIRSYLNELTSSPQTGRRTEEGFRELVIPFGKAGFVALYDYNDAHDLVHVASIRHQREAGYR